MDIILCLIDFDVIFLIKSSEFTKSLNFGSNLKKKNHFPPKNEKSYDEKAAENYINCYLAENVIVSKQSKISIPNCDSTNSRLD